MFSPPYSLGSIDTRTANADIVPGPPHNISPLRREHVPQPPPLTTTVHPAVSHGYAATPLSTTSLSSPFSLNHLGHQGIIPGSATRGISPMSARFAPYNAPYNPQQWAGPSQPGGLSHVRPAQRTQAVDPEGPVASPPPPYSPQSEELAVRTSHVDHNSNLSPAESSRHSSHSNTPTSAFLPTSPQTANALQGQPSRQLPAVRSASSSANFPPPPPMKPISRIGNLLTGVANRRAAAFSPVQGVMQPPSQNRPITQYEPAPGPLSNMIPPGARRAASTGVISAASSSSRSTSFNDSRSPSQDRAWDANRPLPGPPPGPPPSGSRSQSVSGVGDAGARNLLTPAARPKSRHPPALGTDLGSVPPTPVDWVEEISHHDFGRAVGNLHVDTAGLSGTNMARNDPVLDSARGQPNTGSGLSRSSAFRDTSAKGLRERRSNRSSIADMSALSINSNNPWLNSVATSPRASQDPGRVDTAETTPDDLVDREYRKAIGLDSTNSEPRTAADSQHSTPKAVEPAKLNVSANYISQTPPWSAGADPSTSSMQVNGTGFVATKSLPTPPLGQSQRFSGAIGRPISHILNSPNEETPFPSLSPDTQRRSRKSSQRESRAIELTDDDVFILESTRRHDLFVRAEQAASDDVDRLQLFVNYIAEESRIRQERYTSVFDSGSFDAQAARNRVFEPTSKGQRRRSGVLRLVTTSPESMEPPADQVTRTEIANGRGFHPILSPIASLSNDEHSSRGRAPSRWWESQPGSDSDGQRRILERSKRESKYMGISKESIQNAAESLTPRQATWGVEVEASEYPPEKSDPSTFGYYDDRPSPAFQTNSKLPNGPMRLDVSRFITLPPPYPRHHPAVNNNHPDLVVYRTAVRNMSDLSDVNSRKSRYQQSVEALRTTHRRRLSDNRRNFKAEIRAQVEEGSLTYAEAAEAEQALQQEEHQADKKALQQEFDEFTDVVLNPLHNILSSRIEQLDGLITELRHKLLTDAQSPNPDQTQEAGDEEPELLEKLTQLKWLFETREQLHREIFGLLTQRNETYKNVVLLPYRQNNNTEKLRSTDAFFTQDNQERLATFENEALKRYQTFYGIVEDNVTRGVEMQSSAFWDISPSLENLLLKIPEELRDFEGVQIPEAEFAENQSYHSHPLQYLYSVLLHAERSTYQFIEAQTNLHCLLHEVKGSVVSARFRALGSDDPHASQRKAQENDELTKELQQKVGMVENIWTEALGSRIQGTRERVRHFLENEGGWIDDLEQTEG